MILSALVCTEPETVSLRAAVSQELSLPTVPLSEGFSPAKQREQIRSMYPSNAAAALWFMGMGMPVFAITPVCLQLRGWTDQQHCRLLQDCPQLQLLLLLHNFCVLFFFFPPKG